MAASDFLKIEHEEPGGRRVHLVHTGKPPCLVEFKPSYNASGKIVAGTIQRVCLPNEATGYHRTSKLLADAEKAFRQLLTDGAFSAPIRS